MKNVLLLLAALFCTFAAQAQVTPESAVHAYAAEAYQKYGLSLKAVQLLQSDVHEFLIAPTEDNLAKVRITWTEARKIYSQTEVYRFYGGPIDGADGPEGAINAWPLDEVYIDTIIERKDLYPAINAEVLTNLNEKDGEKNISTGFHAIEYLLWGADQSATGPGNRPATDFLTAQSSVNERRAQFLRVVTALLISDLERVYNQWDASDRGSFAAEFLTQTKTSLANILTGVVTLTGSELSQERMFVALDTRSQEEEHSCFSDTTHFDILYNFIGAKNVLNNGILVLIATQDRTLAAEIEENLALTERAIQAMPTPFDQAIVTETGRARVMDVIVALEMLAESVKQGAVTLGIDIP